MGSTDRAAQVTRRALSSGDPANRVLRIGLALLALVASLEALGHLLGGFAWGVDLEIPLRAAERWLAGGQAYVSSAFSNGPGYDLPFLYPPYALPLFAPLTAVARLPLFAAWFAVNVALAIATCRRLGVQPRWIPLVLAWPPFAEGLISENPEIAIFMAFVVVLKGTGSAPPPREEPVRPPKSALGRGLLAAGTVVLKVSQPHAVVHMFRWDRRAALIAVLAIASLVVATLPITGVAIWRDWIDQLHRAADPGWALGGPSLGQLLPAPTAALVVLAFVAAALVVPRAEALEWVGVLIVLGSPALHAYYLLFLLPAMLRIRREIALVAGLFVATYTVPGWWLAIGIVVGTLALARSRAGLRETA